MHDVVTNLLSNAAKYTPEGGCVQLTTWPAGKSAMLRVRDSGIGIAADELPHISERFYRGTNSAGQNGSGIGLAIAEELVRGHHGTMHISSEAGHGTEVTIQLPKALDPARRTRAAAAWT
jgi:signal transduction histidine kinase